MTADQVKALADFLKGLKELTIATGVEIAHYDAVTLRMVDDPERAARMHGERDERDGGYLLAKVGK